MPNWFYDKEPWIEFFPLPAVSLIVAIAIALITHWPNTKRRRDTFPNVLLAAFALALLGAVTGKITGQSRDGAVGAVMPAVLTLLGVLLVYVIKISQKQVQLIAVSGFIAFVLCLAIGINWGAKARQIAELNSLKNEENAKFKAVVQKLVNDARLRRLKLELGEKVRENDSIKK